MKERSMKKASNPKAITQTRLTRAQKTQLAALAAMPEDAIDYSDIAPLSKEFWRAAVTNPLYKPKKTSTTVRIDSDVLLWLKSNGKGYQTRINTILRSAMLQKIHKKT